jgi:hypothetical protein
MAVFGTLRLTTTWCTVVAAFTGIPWPLLAGWDEEGACTPPGTFVRADALATPHSSTSIARADAAATRVHLML